MSTSNIRSSVCGRTRGRWCQGLFSGIRTTSESVATLTLHGVVDDRAAIKLDRSLNELCGTHRPKVVVDLRDVDVLHPSVANSLETHKTQARVNFGSLTVVYQ